MGHHNLSMLLGCKPWPKNLLEQDLLKAKVQTMASMLTTSEEDVVCRGDLAAMYTSLKHLESQLPNKPLLMIADYLNLSVHDTQWCMGPGLPVDEDDLSDGGIDAQGWCLDGWILSSDSIQAYQAKQEEKLQRERCINAYLTCLHLRKLGRLPEILLTDIGKFCGLHQEDKKLITESGQPLAKQAADGLVLHSWTLDGWVLVPPLDM